MNLHYVPYAFPYAFLLGMASLASPCSIITIPTLVAQSRGNRRMVMKFASGFGLSVLALVLSTLAIGKLFTAAYGFYAYILAGMVTGIAGFSMLGVISIPTFSTFTFITTSLTKSSIIGSHQKGLHQPFMSGLLLGGVSLTCVGPALAGLFGLAMTVQSILLKLALSALFVLGSVAPFGLYGLGLSRPSVSTYFQENAHRIHHISACVMLAVSAFMISVGLNGVRA